MRLFPPLSRLSLLLALALSAGAANAAAQRPVSPAANDLPAVQKPPAQAAAGAAALRAMINISGQVKDLDGRTVAGVQIDFYNLDNNQKLSSVLTDSVGKYTAMVGVAGNQKGYKVVPSARTWTFAPPYATLTTAGQASFTMQRSAATTKK